MKTLSLKLNLIIDILNKVLAKADYYKIVSSEYDNINEQLDVKIYYEFQENIKSEFHSGTYIIGIPDYILDLKVLNTDLENYIELMTDVINNEMTNH